MCNEARFLQTRRRTCPAAESSPKKKGGEELSLVISGGFLEVRPDRVVVLADAAERAEEIDVARAEAAKQRAQQRLTERGTPETDDARTEAALRRSLARLKVAAMVKRRRKPGA